MTTFDFITAREFRRSLEADYAEMRRCVEHEAWKSVHVLAGSIVEALLIDYLACTPKPGRTPKDPLTCDLAQAVSLCKSEGILSPRSADLCSVVRSYRNLIHPGRVVRLGEEAPDATSSAIAVGLVDVITREIAKVRRATAGLTAEQILAKIRRDEDALTILSHLLTEAPPYERERLLVDLLPEAYFSIPLVERFDGMELDHLTRERFSTAFRTTLETLDDESRRTVAARFVRILREDDGARVREYSTAFICPDDIEYVPEQHRGMVKEHILGRVGAQHDLESLKLVDGIGSFLVPDDVTKWLDPVIRAFVAKRGTEQLRARLREYLFAENVRTSSDVDAAVLKRVDAWIGTFERSQSPDAPEKVERLRELKADLVVDIPF